MCLTRHGFIGSRPQSRIIDFDSILVIAIRQRIILRLKQTNFVSKKHLLKGQFPSRYATLLLQIKLMKPKDKMIEIVKKI